MIKIVAGLRGFGFVICSYEDDANSAKDAMDRKVRH